MQSRPFSTVCRTLAVSACLLALAGCSSKPETFPVRGRVLVNGKPLAGAEGNVVFHNLDDKLPMARGALQPDGSFELTTFRPGDGAVAGKCQVTVHTFVPGVGTEGEPGYRPPRPVLPLLYTRLDQTPVTATVEPKENRLDLDLKP
jgi:hypothetical protein